MTDTKPKTHTTQNALNVRGRVERLHLRDAYNIKGSTCEVAAKDALIDVGLTHDPDNGRSFVSWSFCVPNTPENQQRFALGRVFDIQITEAAPTMRKFVLNTRPQETAQETMSYDEILALMGIDRGGYGYTGGSGYTIEWFARGLPGEPCGPVSGQMTSATELRLHILEGVDLSINVYRDDRLLVWPPRT